MPVLKPNMKQFNVRMPKDLWVFLKNEATANDTSMTGIVNQYVEKHKKRTENKLTRKAAMVELKEDTTEN